MVVSSEIGGRFEIGRTLAGRCKNLDELHAWCTAAACCCKDLVHMAEQDGERF